MRNKIIFISFIVFLILVIGFTCFYITTRNKVEDDIYISELLIVKDNIEYEIKISQNTGFIHYRENNFEEIIYKFKTKGKARLSIPDLNNVKSEFVISELKPFVDFSYNVKYTDGFKYIKYLMEDGYNIKMYISTSQLFEVFLEKDGKMKRVILFSDTLMTCDMLENAELPSVYEYLKKYNYNSYFDKKFDIELEEK